jgi:glycosyltransferase involved in cell wall biosynthesis
MTSPDSPSRSGVDIPDDVPTGELIQPSRVLHVCESFASGVATSINSFVRHSPEEEHSVLILRLRSHVGPGERLPHINYVDPGTTISMSDAARLISKCYKEINPDVVHLHSTYASACVRMLSTIPRSKIVYTPHCFSFERTDLRPSTRFAIRLLEQVLTLRTGTIAAVNERERNLAQSLSRSLNVTEFSYVPDVPEQWCRTASPAEPDQPIRIATVGRICPQKDPEYFAEVVQCSRGSALPVEWIWIGDGETDQRAHLENLGVSVTGWMDRESVFQMLSSCHIYLHTAAWEGFPICVLEAAAVGVPVVLRSIPSTAKSSLGVVVHSPEDAWRNIESLLAPDPWRLRSENDADTVETIASSEQLAKALSYIYRRKIQH